MRSFNKFSGTVVSFLFLITKIRDVGSNFRVHNNNPNLRPPGKDRFSMGGLMRADGHFGRSADQNAPPVSCPPDWEYLVDRCIYFGSTALKPYVFSQATWAKAKSECLRKQATLFSGRNSEVSNELYQLIKRRRASSPDMDAQSYWIGLWRSPETEGSFMWTDGGRLTTFNEFMNRIVPEPEDNKGDCVLFREIPKYYWEISDCGATGYSWICQKFIGEAVDENGNHPVVPSESEQVDTQPIISTKIINIPVREMETRTTTATVVTTVMKTETVTKYHTEPSGVPKQWYSDRVPSLSRPVELEYPSYAGPKINPTPVISGQKTLHVQDNTVLFTTDIVVVPSGDYTLTRTLQTTSTMTRAITVPPGALMPPLPVQSHLVAEIQYESSSGIFVDRDGVQHTTFTTSYQPFLLGQSTRYLMKSRDLFTRAF